MRGLLTCSPHERREEDGDGGEVTHNADTAHQGQQRVAVETRSPANTNYLAIMKRYEASQPQLVREDVNLKNGDICHNLLDRFGTVFVTI